MPCPSIARSLRSLSRLRLLHCPAQLARIWHDIVSLLSAAQLSNAILEQPMLPFIDALADPWRTLAYMLCFLAGLALLGQMAATIHRPAGR